MHDGILRNLLGSSCAVPEISRFYGIVVFVNYNDHAPPHVHVRRAGENGRLLLEPLGIMDGNLSRSTCRRVLKWASAHAPELLANWYLVRAGRAPFPIPPLKE